MMQMEGGVGSSCLRHYDTLRTKIDICLTPKHPKHLTLELTLL